MGKKSNKTVAESKKDIQDVVSISLEEKVETLKNMGFNFQNIDILKDSSNDIVNDLILVLANIYKDKFFVDINSDLVRIYNNCKVNVYESDLLYKENFDIQLNIHKRLALTSIGNIDKKLKNKLKPKDILITEKVSDEYVYYIKLITDESKVYLDNVRMCKVLDIKILNDKVSMYVRDVDGEVYELPQYLVSGNLDYINKLHNHLDDFYRSYESVAEVGNIAEKFVRKHKNVLKYKINIKEVVKYLKGEQGINNVVHIKGITDRSNNKADFEIIGSIERLEDSITGEDVTDKIEELRIDSFEKDAVHFSIHGHAVYLFVRRCNLESDNIISWAK